MTRFRFIAALLFGAVLPTAVPGQAAPEPLPVTEVADGVFVYQAPFALAQRANAGAIGNAGFVVGRDAVAVIDTGGSAAAGRRLLAAVRARTDRPVRFVVNTHVHPDHTLGNAAFADEAAAFVGHHNLPAALAARAQRYLQAASALVGPDAFAGTRIVPPTTLVENKLTLDLGERRLLLEAWSTAHSNTDLTILDERTGTWFLGDLLFAGHVPALDGNLKGWLRVVADLEGRTAARAVPGHGPASMPWPAALGPMKDYLSRLQADTRRLVREGASIQGAAEAAGRAAPGEWALFRDFHARNTIAAFHEIEWE